jgi:hypothetical protein
MLMVYIELDNFGISVRPVRLRAYFVFCPATVPVYKDRLAIADEVIFLVIAHKQRFKGSIRA